MAPHPQHELSWHSDTKDPQRQVGFSMNLTPERFHGGVFELRDRHTLKPLARVHNTGPGDALLFRISSDLQHRVTAVHDDVAKIACAGWFRATGISFLANLAKQMKSPDLHGPEIDL
jgi:hypothetical protein